MLENDCKRGSSEKPLGFSLHCREDGKYEILQSFSSSSLKRKFPRTGFPLGPSCVYAEGEEVEQWLEDAPGVGGRNCYPRALLGSKWSGRTRNSRFYLTHLYNCFIR